MWPCNRQPKISWSSWWDHRLGKTLQVLFPAKKKRCWPKTSFSCLLLISSLSHPPAYRRSLPARTAPQIISVLARWDAARFRNHLIRPIRSSNALCWIFFGSLTAPIASSNNQLINALLASFPSLPAWDPLPNKLLNPNLWLRICF